MLKVWDCELGKEVRSMGGHTGGITSVVLMKKDEHGRSCEGGAEGGREGVVLMKKDEHGRSCEGGTEGGREGGREWC